VNAATLREVIDRNTTEDEFLATVRDLARRCGWLEYHTRNSRRSTRGFPDLVLVRPPRLIFAELKSETGTVEPAQKIWLYTLGGLSGVETKIWRPRDFERIVEALQR